MNQSSVNEPATPRPDSNVPDGASSHQEQPAEQVPQPDVTLDEVIAAVSPGVVARVINQWDP